MLQITAGVAKELARQRLLVETDMCQEICEILDKSFGVYLTLLGRLASLNMIKKFKKLNPPLQKKIYDRWAGDSQFYGPWELRRADKAKAKPEPMENWIEYDKNQLLKPEFPWGVLSLGGLMRSYAEATEFINDEVNDSSFSSQEKKEIELENSSRLIWQNQLVPGAGWKNTLFNKAQIKAGKEYNLLDPGGKELKPLKAGEKDKSGVRRGGSHQAVGHLKLKTKPEKERMRFHGSVRKTAPEGATASVEDVKQMEAEVDKWGVDYKSIARKETRPGRYLWQTFLRDRVSLVGDLYGLIRGATISGTTSDHAYSFWQLCHELRKVQPSTNDYKYLTKGLDSVKAKASMFGHTKEDLEAALGSIQSDEGFGRLVRLMMLVPLTQMGIEMHHSVHEMASVIGLNFIINWRVGHYDSIFVSWKDLKKLEAQTSAHWQKHGKKKKVKEKEKPPDPNKREFAGLKLDLKVQRKMDTVENKIKYALAEHDKQVLHGYFVTLDPHLVYVEDDDLGGFIVENTTEKNTHRESSYWTFEKYQEFLNKIKTKDGYITGAGINEDFIRNEVFKKLGAAKISNDKKPISTVMTLKNKMGMDYKSKLSNKTVQDRTYKIWKAYRSACSKVKYM